MTLGEKLRQARLEAGLSQRQLCGDTITRNMLSQIENGSARPSMDTLSAFARRLGKPVSWFLEEDTVTSPNRQRMEQARDAFGREEYEAVIRELEHYESPDATFDNEANLLRYLSLVVLAEQAVENGKPVYARSLLEQANAAAGQTVYMTKALRAQWILAMWEADPAKAVILARALETDDRAVLLRSAAALEENQPQKALRVLEAAAVQTPQWQLLRGKAAMAVGDYAQAVQHLSAAETHYPEAIPALEICYRELGDFKMAYFYACKLREQ